MMDNFTYTGLPSRVIFGQGIITQLADEAEALGMSKALVLTTPQQKELGQELLDMLGPQSVGLFGNATMHTPVDVTNDALKKYRRLGADGVISIGGGSTIGLGKAIALHTDAPQLTIPTTYAGSEMTTIIGQTEGGLKTTQKTLKVLPETVLYDVDYSLSLPAIMSVTSGMNAIAHAIEALYAENANPVLSLLAEEGIRALIRALPIITKDLTHPGARKDALYGAWLCAICLGSGGVALHHKLCHVLGGTFNLPHAETHTIVLPHALAYNAPAAPDAMARISRAVGSEAPAVALYDIAKNSGAPTALRDLGMPEDGIDKSVAITLDNPYWNPRALDPTGLRAIVRAAWAGERPAPIPLNAATVR